MDEIILNGSTYLVGEIEKESIAEVHEYWGCRVMQETSLYTVKLESVWVRVNGDDIDVTKLLTDKQKEELKEKWIEIAKERAA